MFREYGFSLTSFRYRDFFHCLVSPLFLGRDYCTLLEQDFNDMYTGYHSLCFGAARASLVTLLQNIKTDDKREVILPAFSCVVVSNAILAAGCKPVFCDIDRENFSLDRGHLSSLVNNNTCAIIFQHVLGRLDDGLKEIRKIYPGLFIIEDCAHTLGGEHADGSIVGGDGDASFFSFEQSKPITSWEGGMLIIRDRELFDKVLSSRNLLPRPSFLKEVAIYIKIVTCFISYNERIARRGKYLFSLVNKLFAFSPSMDSDELNGRYDVAKHGRISSFRAKLLRSQLKSIGEALEKRKSIARIYDEIFAGYEAKGNHFILRYPLLVDDPEVLVQKGVERGVKLGRWFSSAVYPANDANPIFGVNMNELPNARQVHNRIINLPITVRMNESDVRRVGAIVKELIR